MTATEKEYSSLKAFAHADRLVQLQAGGQPAPVHVQLILSDLCSHNCSFCAYRMEGYTTNELFGIDEPLGRNNNPNRMIPTLKAREIIDSCQKLGVKAIQFTGGGEPTVHPDHCEIFDYALSKGIEIALVTHGVLLKPQAMDVLMRASWVRVSIDAGRKSTYSTIRRVSDRQFDQAIQNLQFLVQRKRETGSSVTIGMGFVVTAENWSEVYEAANLAKSIGVDIFRISAVFQSDGADYFNGWGEKAELLCGETKLLESETFKVANSFPRRLQDLHDGSPDYQMCGYQHFTTYIGADLNVYRCCSTSYSSRGLIGSIKDMTFDWFWNSSFKFDSFSSFDARGCERCQFNKQNRAINEVLFPAHVNFV